MSGAGWAQPRPGRWAAPSSRVPALAAHVLRDFVAQQAVLHPADHKQVDERAQGPVADPVLAHAEPSRPVVHRHLEDPEPPHLEQRGDEAVEALVEGQVPQALAPEGAERAAAVLDRLLAEPIAHTV